MTVAVWWSRLTEAGAHLEALLDAVELERAAALARPADRGRSMLGAALLRAAVADDLGCAPRDVEVDRTCAECGAPHGAPRIVRPDAPRRWVSVSHSGLLVAVAVSAEGPVGIDVQRCADLPEGGDARAWVAQEARFKAFGAPRGAPGPRGDARVRSLEPPVPGYAAALATSTPGREPRVAHWSP